MIKLTSGNLIDLPLKAEGTMVTQDLNKLFASDDEGTVQGVSDIHIGPTQPLAGTRLWQDTNTMTLKYNDGTAWVETVATIDNSSKDYGSFDPEPTWLDISAAANWVSPPVNENGVWTITENSAWIEPIGTAAELALGITAESYAAMAYWWKGLRFSKIRIFFDSGEYLTLADNADNTILSVSSVQSGVEYDCTWQGTGYWADLKVVFLSGGALTTVTKIEVLI